ncbi:MAG: 1-acyl-sn-glycerol-3-phosphate acyltransferase [Planctomycetia bacterium]|nr:1-acyl-sn-glycerol-3-phosphate acyltransferase [Planctomycetia bacterium]
MKTPTLGLVSEAPYQFQKPPRSRWWWKLLAPIVLPLLRRFWARVERFDFHGGEALKESLAAGHGILLAPNHARPTDPLVCLYLAWVHGFAMYGMTSWHLFQNHGLVRNVARRMGAFSIFREGSDRESLTFAIDSLATADRPVTILPEGGLSRTNDRLRPLLDGLAFVARTAARKRSKQTPPGQVVVHPVAIKYWLLSDLNETIAPFLESTERTLALSAATGMTLFQRIERIIDTDLAKHEVRVLGTVQSGSLTDRLEKLCVVVLTRLESEWSPGAIIADDFVIRVKNLRTVLLVRLAENGVTETQREEIWQPLNELDNVHQWALLFPRDYLQADSPQERFVETIERMDEYFTGSLGQLGRWRVEVQIGAAIPVSALRDKSAEVDPLMEQLKTQLQGMLNAISVRK